MRGATAARRAATAAVATWIAATVASGGLPRTASNEGVAPAPGVFLVATRDLADPNFRHTVVLLLGYGPGGALGVIVNRPTEIPVASLFPDKPALRRRDDRIWLGGPVSRTELLCLVRTDGADEGLDPVFDDVYLGRGEGRVGDVADGIEPGRPLRVFAGFAGWGPGQLDAELGQGGWHLVRATADLVFEADPAAVWERLLPRDPLEVAQR